MKKTDIIFVLICLLLAATVLAYMALPWVSELIRGQYATLYLATSIGILFFSLHEQQWKISRTDFFLIGFVILYSLACWKLNGLALGNVVTIISSVILVRCLATVKCSIRHPGIWLMLFGLLVFYFYLYSRRVVLDFYNDVEDTLNPNLVAQMVLMYLILFLHIAQNCKIPSVFRLAMIVLSELAIYQCQSRTVFLLSVLFILLVLLRHFVKPLLAKDKFFTICFLAIFAVGILVPFVFVRLYTNYRMLSLPLFSKSLYSGREKNWLVVLQSYNSVWRLLKGVPFRSYSTLVTKVNLHNIFLTVSTNYGYPFCLLYYSFFLRVYRKLTHLEENYYLVIGMMVIMLIGAFENILFSMAINYLFCLFLFVSVKETEELRPDHPQTLSAAKSTKKLPRFVLHKR